MITAKHTLCYQCQMSPRLSNKFVVFSWQANGRGGQIGSDSGESDGEAAYAGHSGENQYGVVNHDSAEHQYGGMIHHGNSVRLFIEADQLRDTCVYD